MWAAEFRRIGGKFKDDLRCARPAATITEQMFDPFYHNVYRIALESVEDILPNDLGMWKISDENLCSLSHLPKPNESIYYTSATD